MDFLRDYCGRSFEASYMSGGLCCCFEAQSLQCALFESMPVDFGEPHSQECGASSYSPRVYGTLLGDYTSALSTRCLSIASTRRAPKADG